MFQNRKEAGQKLARLLKLYKEKNAVVYSLPRGGVVIGAAVAGALSLPHDIVVTRKIGHPTNSEYAIGAVNDSGDFILNDRESGFVDKEYLERELRKEVTEAQRRTSLYRGETKPVSASGKTAIIVDDGIATGYTMKLAVRTIRKMNPEKIIVATPIAPSEAVRDLQDEGVEVVILAPPEEFRGAIGAHYREFEQTSDKEVVDLLCYPAREIISL